LVANEDRIPSILNLKSFGWNNKTKT
jgi:hypothetical protein